MVHRRIGGLLHTTSSARVHVHTYGQDTLHVDLHPDSKKKTKKKLKNTCFEMAAGVDIAGDNEITRRAHQHSILPYYTHARNITNNDTSEGSGSGVSRCLCLCLSLNPTPASLYPPCLPVCLPACLTSLTPRRLTPTPDPQSASIQTIPRHSPRHDSINCYHYCHYYPSSSLTTHGLPYYQSKTSIPS